MADYYNYSNVLTMQKMGVSSIGYAPYHNRSMFWSSPPASVYTAYTAPVNQTDFSEDYYQLNAMKQRQQLQQQIEGTTTTSVPWFQKTKQAFGAIPAVFEAHNHKDKNPVPAMDRYRQWKPKCIEPFIPGQFLSLPLPAKPVSFFQTTSVPETSGVAKHFSSDDLSYDDYRPVVANPGLLPRSAVSPFNQTSSPATTNNIARAVNGNNVYRISRLSDNDATSSVLPENNGRRYIRHENLHVPQKYPRSEAQNSYIQSSQVGEYDREFKVVQGSTSSEGQSNSSGQWSSQGQSNSRGQSSSEGQWSSQGQSNSRGQSSSEDQWSSQGQSNSRGYLSFHLEEDDEVIYAEIDPTKKKRNQFIMTTEFSSNATPKEEVESSRHLANLSLFTDGVRSFSTDSEQFPITSDEKQIIGDAFQFLDDLD